MELSKNYNPSTVDGKWYSHWIKKNYFHSVPDEREPYTIVIPPPNVTGVLHMGHCLNNTIQDVLARRARMQGKNTCWVPGTDHASIATEAKVVGMLRERGINKSNLSREEFLKYAWEWKEKYGGIILQQLRKLGCSCDWDRTTFTMDPHYYETVINVFIDLYNKGLIYRGERMIHWDPKAKTALSDEEVIYREVNSKLYYVKYFLDNNGKKDSNAFIVIATTRPETILGDTAIAVNPNDERYKSFVGKYAYVPLIDRKIKIIADDYVTMEFGTGALKITPAHDMNDYQLGLKHNLEIVDVLNEDGTMSQAAQLFIGQDRFEARKRIAVELEEKGFISKIEDYTNQLGFSERTDAVIEPRLSLQWWVKMKPLAEPALKSVMDEEIQFYPSKFRNLYKYWMENIRDWCISRQLWWGQRIPAWYDDKGNYVVAPNENAAIEEYKKKYGALIQKLKQDEDVLDTWFSSWLWPIEVFKGYSNPNNADINYYYPTSTLVTAPEIIFFWVARMIMSGFEYKKAKPFSDVYFTGIVRDKQGRKMSKQLGNSPDLLALIDDYGADAVRFGILISSPAGNDLLFDAMTLDQGRNFNNKLWNAMKLVLLWRARTIDHGPRTTLSVARLPSLGGQVEDPVGGRGNFAVEWFENRLNQARRELDQLFKEFRLSEALKNLYSLIWDDFCSWYLEWIKPAQDQPMSKFVYDKTIGFFDQLLQLLHPFMPFITEEIYHILAERKQGDDIIVKQFPPLGVANGRIIEQGRLLQDAITSIREARAKNNIKPKDPITLHLQTSNKDLYVEVKDILLKQVNATDLQITNQSLPGSLAVVVGRDTFYIESTVEIDTGSQRINLEKDLQHLKGFLDSVNKKLSNERFVSNAKPEVVDLEKKKKEDAEAKIRAIEESLANLN
jgi:valyl-tRNA synthetase